MIEIGARQIVSDTFGDEVRVSVCVNCARHPSLKQIIRADCVTGLCAFCGRLDATVRNPDSTEPMVMLIRALIRLYCDEFEYNGHWGGDSVLDLFIDDGNPVLKPALTDDYLDEFEYLLQEPTYPPTSDGVARGATTTTRPATTIAMAVCRVPAPPPRQSYDAVTVAGAFRNCTEARAAGAAPVRRPGLRATPRPG